MRWPWDKTEKRQAGGGAYSAAIVSLLQSRASGASIGEPNAIAALEVAAGLWARAFARAELAPTIAAVTPSVLASVGRELVRRGESLWAIDVRRGEIVLTPAASWDVAGGSDPASWVYRLDLFGPSGGETRLYPSASVLSFKYASDPERPWAGVSPMSYARLSGKLAANLELRLGEEANAKVGHLLPVPADGGDGSTSDPLAILKSDLAALRGNTALVETTSAAWGEGKGAAPQSDWKPQRMGADPPRALAELRGAAAEDVLAACGVPPALASGTAEGHVPAGELGGASASRCNLSARCVARGIGFQAGRAGPADSLRGARVRRYGRKGASRGRVRRKRAYLFRGRLNWLGLRG